MKKLFQRIDLFLNNLYTNNTTQTVRDMVLQYLDVLVNGEYTGLTNNKFHFVETNKDTGTVHQDTEGYQNFNQYTYSRETTGNPVYLQNYSLPFETVQNFSQIKICMDTVANQESILPANIRVYNSGSSYSTMTKANFMAAYGDYVMFDYKKFNLTYPVAAPYSLLRLADASGNLITEDHPVALQLQKGNDKINFGLIYTPAGSVTDYYRAPESGFGISEIFKVFNTGNNVAANRLFLIYSAIKGGVDTNSNNIFTMMGDYGKRFASTSGSNYSFMWKKEIIDEYLIDLMDATRIVASYTGNIESPDMPEEAIPTEPGQPENDVDNAGGTGELILDDLDFPTNPYTSTGVGMNSYGLTVFQTNEFVHAFNNPAIFQTLTGLDLSQCISMFLWPFILPSSSTTVPSIQIGKASVSLEHAVGSVNAYKYTGQTPIHLSFGELQIPLYFRGFLDYEPFTQIQIYLPYLGIMPVKANDINGKKIKLDLYCDLLTGQGLYTIQEEYKSGKWVVIYKWPCEIGQPLMITSENMAVIQNAIMTNGVTGAINTGIGAFAGGKGSANASNIGGGVNNLLGTVHDQISATNPTMIGSQGDSNDRQLIQTPYLLIKRPTTTVPDLYNQTKGRPSLLKRKLSDLKGFTAIENPLINTTATQTEKEEIIQLLQEGVYIK